MSYLIALGRFFYAPIASKRRELHGVDPQRYLMSVLAKVRQAKLSALEQFLQDVWKAEDAAEPTLPAQASGCH